MALSKVEKFYIDGNPGLKPEELSKILGKSLASIKRYRADNPVKEVVPVQSVVVAAEPVPPKVDMIAKGEHREGIAVMTPNISEYIDETRQKGGLIRDPSKVFTPNPGKKSY